jgi:hypothetical protein
MSTRYPPPKGPRHESHPKRASREEGAKFVRRPVKRSRYPLE